MTESKNQTDKQTDTSLPEQTPAGNSSTAGALDPLTVMKVELDALKADKLASETKLVALNKQLSDVLESNAKLFALLNAKPQPTASNDSAPVVGEAEKLFKELGLE